MKMQKLNQVWWCISIILALRMLKEEDYKTEASHSKNISKEKKKSWKN
jgi:hypothetical protein